MRILKALKRLVTTTCLGEVICRFLYYTILPLYQRLSHSRGAIILLYHDVTRAGFERAVSYLQTGGRFNIITLDSLIGHLENGKSLPEKSLVITFDDGLKSVYREAFPVVLERNIPITVYLISGSLTGGGELDKENGSREYLDAKEVKELAQSGLVEFGSHTRSHPCLARIPLEEARREIAESKRQLETVLGSTVAHFAYPYGGPATFSAEHVAMLKRYGYRSAVSNVHGANNKDTSLYKLKRLGMRSECSRYVLAVYLSGLLHKMAGAYQ
jgi:peptidoglycan/xylan/chitin deacetylase (PgdA/CDA1 family)